MSTSSLFRLGGVAGLLSGLTLVISSLGPEHPAILILGLLSAVLGLYTLTALYLGQREASGSLGGTGYIVNTFGLALITGAAYATATVFTSLDESVVDGLFAGPAGLAFLLSFVLFVVGIVLFGIATLRAGVYSPAAAVLYMVGFAASLAVFLLRLPEIVGDIAEAAAGVGIAWFGYELWSGTREGAS
jgi:hypothetical protein